MNQQQKDTWLVTMRDHQEHDRFRQGAWLRSDGRGCFYGCAMQTRDDVLVKAAEAMGLPLWFVELTEAIFEGLPNYTVSSEALQFPVKVLEAIPVDTDLTPVMHSMAIVRLTSFVERYGNVKTLINDIVECHENWETTTKDRWAEVRRAARLLPTEVLEVIPEGTEMTPAMHSTAIAQLASFAARYSNVVAAINDAIECHKNWETTTDDCWTEVEQVVRDCAAKVSASTYASLKGTIRSVEAWQADRTALLNALKELS
jgi:hypothetical protein